MVVITYWMDEDPDMINSVICKTGKESAEICKVLEKYGFDIIASRKINPTTAKEMEEMLNDAYAD